MMRHHPPTRIGSRSLPAAMWAVCDMCDRPQVVLSESWLCEHCTVVRRNLLDQPRRVA